MSYRRILLAALGGALAATIWMWRPAQAPNWSPAEVSQIETLWIENLPPVPIDPTNAVADDPKRPPSSATPCSSILGSAPMVQSPAQPVISRFGISPMD